MKSQTGKFLKIKIIDSDVDNIKSAFKKICDTDKQIGYKNIGFTPEESETIKKFNEKINA